MDYYKFIDKTSFPLPFCGWIQEGEEIISNPPIESILSLGYKPIEFSEEPTTNPEVYTSVWQEQDDKIIQIWEKIDDDDVISTGEALDIVTGGIGI